MLAAFTARDAARLTRAIERHDHLAITSRTVAYG
jgi:hypothetical protein